MRVMWSRWNALAKVSISQAITVLRNKLPCECYTLAIGASLHPAYTISRIMTCSPIDLQALLISALVLGILLLPEPLIYEVLVQTCPDIGSW